MSKYIEDVKKFHETFGHPVNNVSDDIELKTRQLRVKLLFEELEELAEASGVLGTFGELCYVSSNVGDGVDSDNVDKIEELDALCDIQYILAGSILALGHQDNFDKAFQNVQYSNMSKACANLQEVEDTIGMYVNERGMSRENISYEILDDIFIVYRVDDGKILKNKHYTPTDLKKFI